MSVTAINGWVVPFAVAIPETMAVLSRWARRRAIVPWSEASRRREVRIQGRIGELMAEGRPNSEPLKWNENSFQIQAGSWVGDGTRS